MNKSNRVKLVIAVLLIAVVAIATVSYGNSQRKKVATNDPTQGSLPTIQDAQKDQKNPSKPGESQPAPQKPAADQAPKPVPVATNPSTPQAVQPQLTQGRTPATGPEDHLLPIIVLGAMSGLYLVSLRKARQPQSFDNQV